MGDGVEKAGLAVEEGVDGGVLARGEVAPGGRDLEGGADLSGAAGGDSVVVCLIFASALSSFGEVERHAAGGAADLIGKIAVVTSHDSHDGVKLIHFRGRVWTVDQAAATSRFLS